MKLMSDANSASRGAYYNEFDPYAAQWLRNLIEKNLIPRGEVDERSIVDVGPDDLVGFRQCHFFAGIGGWALAARLAGWPDDREIWSGSLPCQPFSVAGEQRGFDDERDLWHHQLRLIRARRPVVFVGEQVAAAIGKHWLDRLFFDLQAERYTGRGAVIPACAVNAPHRRDRVFVIADSGSGALDHGVGDGLEGFAWHGDEPAGWADEDRPVAETGGGEGREQRSGQLGGAGGDPGACGGGVVADATGERCAREHALLREGEAGRDARGLPETAGSGAGSFWSAASWIIGHDGKARRVEPGIRLLAHGVPARVGRLRAYGNAIVPQVAAEVIAAYMDCRP